jgi:aminoglycoside phosphotransferase (APT) family kinase protein
MATPHPGVDQLAEVVAEQAGVPRDRLRLRRCPTGKFNTTYFVDGGPAPLVLRVAPPDDRARLLFYEHRMMRQEPALHDLLRSKTRVPVPRVVAHDFSRRRLDVDYLLMERLPGKPLSEAGGLDSRALGRVLAEVGACLRQAHALTANSYGYLGEHRPMDPQPDWPSAFRVMWHKLLDDIRDCGGYSAEEADSLRRLLDRHAKAFERPVPASLLHMDVWAQNILVGQRGGMTGLLDWDRALWGDPEIEFAVLDYCGISEPAFWEGYGSPRDTSPEADVRRTFYLLYELQKYIVIRRVRDRDARRAEGYRTQALALARALG